LPSKFREAHRNEFRPVDPELAAFVCVTSIEALTHTAVLHHSDSFSDEMFEALVDEGTQLIVRYLAPTFPSGRDATPTPRIR
jgi:hypothetical protein